MKTKIQKLIVAAGNLIAAIENENSARYGKDAEKARLASVKLSEAVSAMRAARSLNGNQH